LDRDFSTVYEEVIVYELSCVGIRCARQVEIPIQYDQIKLDVGFRVDIMVEDKVIIALKSIESILPVHKKQLLTYLKLTHLKLGLLINFNTEKLKDGIVRIVNNL